ncbi:MAG: extracellular solute-binding protein [Candidatus Omnitrophica bacterium]|nr:extracellular solute-binding protein [Candidatus Omnitrophota bacterium]
MKRRVPPWGIIAGLLLAALFGGSLLSAEPEVMIDFWELSVGEDLMRSLLDKFERQHPGIRVRFQQLSWDYGLDKIITSIAAGNAPDLCELGTDWVPQFSSTGVLRDLTEPQAPLKDGPEDPGPGG